jgi:hypothetical protein
MEHAWPVPVEPRVDGRRIYPSRQNEGEDMSMRTRLFGVLALVAMAIGVFGVVGPAGATRASEASHGGRPLHATLLPGNQSPPTASNGSGSESVASRSEDKSATKGNAKRFAGGDVKVRDGDPPPVFSNHAAPA